MEETKGWRGLPTVPRFPGQDGAELTPGPLLARKPGVKRPQRALWPPSESLWRAQHPPFHIQTTSKSYWLFLQNPASVSAHCPRPLLPSPVQTISSHLLQLLTTSLSSSQVCSRHSSQRDPGKSQASPPQCCKLPMASSSP